MYYEYEQMSELYDAICNEASYLSLSDAWAAQQKKLADFDKKAERSQARRMARDEIANHREYKKLGKEIGDDSLADWSRDRAREAYRKYRSIK